MSYEEMQVFLQYYIDELQASEFDMDNIFNSTNVPNWCTYYNVLTLLCSCGFTIRGRLEVNNESFDITEADFSGRFPIYNNVIYTSLYLEQRYMLHRKPNITYS